MDPDVAFYLQKRESLCDEDGKGMRNTPMRIKDMIALLLLERKDFRNDNHRAGAAANMCWFACKAMASSLRALNDVAA